MGCLHCRSYRPIFLRASCSWRSEGLFGQFFSTALPVQARGGLPRLGSFSVVWHVRHIEGPPGGVLLRSSVRQGFGGPASLLLSCRCRLWGEALVLAAPPAPESAASPGSTAAWLSSTGVSHHDLLPHIPSTHLSAVSSSPRPGVAPRSLSSSSQPPHLPRGLQSCPGCVAAARTADLIPLRLPQTSGFTLSLQCFSSDSDNCPDVGIGPPLQSPHPPRAGPVLATLLFSLTPPSFARFCALSPAGQALGRLSAGVPLALLGLKPRP